MQTRRWPRALPPSKAGKVHRTPSNTQENDVTKVEGGPVRAKSPAKSPERSKEVHDQQHHRLNSWRGQLRGDGILDLNGIANEISFE
jgi:hypothetical protein